MASPQLEKRRLSGLVGPGPGPLLYGEPPGAFRAGTGHCRGKMSDSLTEQYQRFGARSEDIHARRRRMWPRPGLIVYFLDA